MTHKVGDIVTMTNEALDNYGEQWRGVRLKITHKATKYMPAAEFFSKGKPIGFHPGYDKSSGGPLFELQTVETGEPLGFSLYQWEVQ
jgi:hypothetical protein